MKLIKIFLAGLSISFLGSLPLGTVNVAAMQISITDGYYQAMLFSLGTCIVEMVYIRIILILMDRIMRHSRLLKMLQWLSLFIIVALAVSSFIAATAPDPVSSKNILLSNAIPSFLLGAFMMSVNAIQVPFWLGWSTVLYERKILKPLSNYYNIYMISIGLGSFLGSCIFIFSGQLLTGYLQANQNILNWIIGGVFAITAVIYLYKILKKKNYKERQI